MKILFISIIISVCATINCSAQSNDSLAVQRANHLKQVLSLSDSQYISVQPICLQFYNDMNYLQSLKLDSKDRGVQLQQIQDDYHTALQNILTTNQWALYESRRQAVRQAFEQHMQAQNIKYNFLSNQ